MEEQEEGRKEGRNNDDDDAESRQRDARRTYSFARRPSERMERCYVKRCSKRTEAGVGVPQRVSCEFFSDNVCGGVFGRVGQARPAERFSPR